MKVYYNPNLKDLSRKLRKSGTTSEILLWEKIKTKQLNGYQFSRQKPIGNYIVDFYCNKLNLVIEIDGDSHIGKFDYDFKRIGELKKIGLNILTFEDIVIKENLDAVIESIKNYIAYFENTNKEHSDSV